MAEPSYYQILGVKETSSQTEIEQAYKKLAIRYHPDKNPNGEEQFKKICLAYTELSDARKRMIYDMKKNVSTAFSSSSSVWTPTSQPCRKKSANTIVPLNVTIKQLYVGETIKITEACQFRCHLCEIAPTDKCEACEGKGKLEMPLSLEQCDFCKGTGLTSKTNCRMCHGQRVHKVDKEFTIHIDPGMMPGQEISLIRRGDEQPGCRAGDRIFKLRLEEQSEFKICCQDLVKKISINLAMVLGAALTVPVKLPNEKVLDVALPQGETIQIGDKFQVHNYGMPVYSSSFQKGNLVLEVTDIEMPQTFDHTHEAIKQLDVKFEKVRKKDEKMYMCSRRDIAEEIFPKFAFRPQPKKSFFQFQKHIFNEIHDV